MKIIAIIQARMSSTRLPGKVLLDIAGKPMLARVIERTRQALNVNNVIVASTTDSLDDAIVDYCAEQNIPCFRGSLYDVLDRYYQAARASAADVIVRITGDCPVIDPNLIDEVVEALLGGKSIEPGGVDQSYSPGYFPNSSRVQNLSLITSHDFAANRLPPPWKRTYPIGLDTEVCTFQALERAWKKANQSFQREHVMPYFYDDIPLVNLHPSVEQRMIQTVSPRGFRVVLINSLQDYGTLRWTVDTPEDLKLIRRIFFSFDGRSDFSWLDILELMKQQPELGFINAAVRPKILYQTDDRSAGGLDDSIS